MIDLAARVEECCGVALESLPSKTRELLAQRLDGVDPDQAREVIVGLVSIGETMFMRHGKQLSALREHLPRHWPPWSTNRPLQVWSAGCSSGEEVYSLAALFRELARPARIVGTDLNQDALARAREGHYRPWSLRRVPPEWTARWLKIRGRNVVVSPELRKLVTFQAHDLSHDPFPPAQDLILCRNVLIYFSAHAREQVFARFAEALAPNGLLLLAPTDGPPGEGWTSVGDICGLYRRGRAEQRARRAPLRRAPAPRSARPSRPRPGEVQPQPTTTHEDPISETVWSLAGQGEHDAALETLDAALAARPLAVELWVQRAMIAEEAGLLDQATEAARRACLLAPSAAAPNVWLGCCLLAQGEANLASNRFKLAEHAMSELEDEHLVPHTGGMSAADLRRLVAALAGESK